MVPAFLPDLTPPAAATLTAPWLLACGLAALHGLLRLRARRSLALPELALDLALLWLLAPPYGSSSTAATGSSAASAASRPCSPPATSTPPASARSS